MSSRGERRPMECDGCRLYGDAASSLGGEKVGYCRALVDVCRGQNWSGGDGFLAFAKSYTG